MAAYTGTLVGTPKLGLVGATARVLVKYTFSAATLVQADTFTCADTFVQNGVAVPVEVIGFSLWSSTTTPASLTMTAGNSDDTDGFMKAVGMTATGQLVRRGGGDLIGTRITNKGTSLTVTVDAGTAYTGDIYAEYVVARTND